MSDLATVSDGGWFQFLKALDQASSVLVDFDEDALVELADHVPTEAHRQFLLLAIRRGRQQAA